MKTGFQLRPYPALQHTITPSLLVPGILPGTPLEGGEPVLASGFLLALCEAACWQALREVREPSEAILGTRFVFSHVAPAAAGDTLTITPTSTDVTSRGEVDWSISAVNTSTGRPVAVMQHRSRIVDRRRFRRLLLHRETSP